MLKLGTLTPFILAALALAPAPALSITAEDLIEKNLAARGGREKLAAVRTLQSEGKMVFGGSFELAFKQVAKGGNAVRDETTTQGLTSVQAYDGTEGWAINPFQGRRDPERMSADELKGMRESADFNGFLVDYKLQGQRLEYLGLEDIDGTLAHKLRLTDKAGDEQLVYLDPDYFLEIRTVSRRTLRGNEQVRETDIGDYEKVDGVYFPFVYAIGPKGSDDKPQQIILEKIVANVEVEDALFAFPERSPSSGTPLQDPSETGVVPPPPPAQREPDPAEVVNPQTNTSEHASGATP